MSSPLLRIVLMRQNISVGVTSNPAHGEWRSLSDGAKLFNSERDLSPSPSLSSPTPTPCAHVGHSSPSSPQLKGLPPQGPAFVTWVGDSFSPLTYPTFVSTLRQALTKCGVDPSQYAGHSFRRGGASWALQSGLPGDVIQLMGDWKSDAYKQYLVMPIHSKLQSLKTFSKALPNAL